MPSASGTFAGPCWREEGIKKTLERGSASFSWLKAADLERSVAPGARAIRPLPRPFAPSRDPSATRDGRPALCTFTFRRR